MRAKLVFVQVELRRFSDRVCKCGHMAHAVLLDFLNVSSGLHGEFPDIFIHPLGELSEHAENKGLQNAPSSSSCAKSKADQVGKAWPANVRCDRAFRVQPANVPFINNACVDDPVPQVSGIQHTVLGSHLKRKELSCAHLTNLKIQGCSHSNRVREELVKEFDSQLLVRR